MNPYIIKGPALISFSGGRTSRYMLKHILDVNEGLPPGVHVVFANTGKEMPETLDFVQRTSTEYGVPITWLEYDRESPHRTKVVSHNSASRNGEPYAQLIKARSFLPNPVMRFCTTELKIRRFNMYAVHWLGFEHWTSVIGLRADENRRVEKLAPRNAAKKDRWQTIAPLAKAGVEKRHVLDWSFAQPFDLALPVDEEGDTVGGNCDLCFLKARRKIEKLILEDPSRADWWVEKEEELEKQSLFKNLSNPHMAKFRADRAPYSAIRRHALEVREIKNEIQRRKALTALPNEDDGDCMCHD